MGVRPGRRSRWHHDDVAYPRKRASGDTWSVTLHTATGHSRVVHLPAGKTLETGLRGRLVAGPALGGVGAGQVVARHACGYPTIVAGRTGACISTQH